MCNEILQVSCLGVNHRGADAVDVLSHQVLECTLPELNGEQEYQGHEHDAAACRAQHLLPEGPLLVLQQASGEA